MTDDELQDWMRDELFLDPKVDSAAIAVSANAGEVTLRGTVASFRQKREAQRAAERVYGVTSVRNQLEVRIVDEHGRQDGEQDAEGPEPHHARTVSGVPMGMSLASRRIAALRRRMHPWETAPGRRSGRLVPWMPMKPPAGQSVRVADRALVPNAIGP